MKYAIRALEEEKRQLELCLSDWDIKKYPDARIERQVRLDSLIKAITCLNKLQNGCVVDLKDGSYGK